MSDRIKAAIIGLALAISVALGCSAQQLRAVEIYNCRVEAMAKALGDELAEDAVREVVMGKASPADILGRASVSPEDYVNAKRAWDVCVPSLELVDE